MIDKDSVERLITELQELLASYAEHEAFLAKHAKLKAECDRLQQVRRDEYAAQQRYEDLHGKCYAAQQQLNQLNSDITRRSGELQRIDSQIAQAKQRAFGG